MRSTTFLMSFIYNCAHKINRFSFKVINYIDRSNDKINNEKWLNIFKGFDKIIFQIAEIKLNLYKDSILSQFIYEGFEKEEIDFMLRTLNQNDFFIDIGSNIGLFSLIASKKVGSKGKVICFEPSQEIYGRLIENIELNEFKNIEARNIGLSDKEGELKFYFSDQGFDAWNSFAPDSRLKKSINVNASTLDKQLDYIDKSKIKMVKIDVEGWEKFVIKGGCSFFANYSPIVMVEFTEENTFNAGYSVHDIFIELESLGYEWFRIENGNLIEEKKHIHYPYTNLVAKKRVDLS